VNPARQCNAKVRTVEVGDSDGADHPFVPQLLQIEQRVEPARVGESPGVELHQVNAVAAQSIEGALDSGAHFIPA
jgi:hypothetical protein